MAKAHQTKQTPVVNTSALIGRLKTINTRGIMFVAIVLMAFVIGRLTQRVEDLQGGLATNNTTTTATQQQQQPAANPTINLATVKDLWSKDVIKLGDASKKLLFVEIGDPSCPYCSVASGKNHNVTAISPQFANFKLVEDGGTYVSPVTEMKKLVDSGQAGFVYIYFPGHGSGEMSMKALYCAQEKGKFWQAHDLLMTADGYNQVNNVFKNDKAQSGAIANYLKSAVDATFLKSCLDSGKYDQRLAADQTLATSLFTEAKAQMGTPGFIVNDKVFPGAYNWTDMKSVVDIALK